MTRRMPHPLPLDRRSGRPRLRMVDDASLFTEDPDTDPDAPPLRMRVLTGTISVALWLGLGIVSVIAITIAGSWLLGIGRIGAP